MFPIKVITATDEKDLTAFNKLVGSGALTARTIIAGVMLGIYILLILMLYYLGRIVPIYIWIAAAFIAAWFVYILLMPQRIKKKLHKVYEQQGMSESVYLFFEEHFEDDYKNKLTSGHESMSYSSLEKIVENSEYFYLFHYRTRAHIIHKSGMTHEEIDALRSLLRPLFPGKKYKLQQ